MNEQEALRDAFRKLADTITEEIKAGSEITIDMENVIIENGNPLTHSNIRYSLAGQDYTVIIRYQKPRDV